QAQLIDEARDLAEPAANIGAEPVANDPTPDLKPVPRRRHPDRPPERYRLPAIEHEVIEPRYRKLDVVHLAFVVRRLTDRLTHFNHPNKSSELTIRGLLGREDEALGRARVAK